GWAHESFEPSVSRCVRDDPSLAVAPPTPCTFDSFFGPSNVNPKGGVFGFQFGHNWQWGPVLGGLELDASWADLTGSSTFSLIDTRNIRLLDTFTTDKKIDGLASVRGRLGYLILPPLLLYGTAGIGWGHERITTVASRFDRPTSVLLL